MTIQMVDFQSLYERHAAEVRRFALYLCGNPAMADDITSETFVRAWIARAGIRELTVKSYLFTIARNLYHDMTRRSAGRIPAELHDNIPDGRAGTQAQLEQSAELRAVLAGLQELAEIDRAALLMRALDEMPYEEIADTLGITVVTAKVKVHRARLKLMQTRESHRNGIQAAGANA
ncbi:MAG TPA: RNA polymerase sigma factor [Candidatus Acidoferrales bacterium]|nr:RNA polymerase sigma factor [Candidatus Acidoferrales bacterium]